MTEFALNCPDNCSLGPGTEYGPTASQMLADGATFKVVQTVAAEAGFPISNGAISRHAKHVQKLIPDEVDEVLPNVAPIRVLEEVIAKGYANKKNWKPTISDTMKALEMHYRLTQGNPFDELVNALAEAATEIEAPEAISDDTGD